MTNALHPAHVMWYATLLPNPWILFVWSKPIKEMLCNNNNLIDIMFITENMQDACDLLHLHQKQETNTTKCTANYINLSQPHQT